MYKEFYSLTQYVGLKKAIYKKNTSLPADGYTVTVKEDGAYIIEYANARAKEYAKRALCDQKREGKYPVLYLRDHPSFTLRGVVEGFYGKPYTHEQRMELIALLHRLKMNAYIYAPKDDAYHRDKWREDYPEADEKRIKALFKQAKKHNIDFYFAISPGNDFDFAGERDYEILLQKLRKVQAFGVTKFALLMDDIKPELSEEAQKRFSSPAAAHADLANYLLKNLKPAPPFLFCPTDYMQNFDTPYRQALRETLAPEIGVFWTGYNTVAEAITEQDGVIVTETFGRKPVLWDNYPVNDFEPKRRIYLGAISNRARRLHETHAGYIANLSELYECSKIPLMTVAEYAWDCEGYCPERALKNAVHDYFKGCARAGEKLVRENAANIMQANGRRTAWFAEEKWRALDKHYADLQKALKTLKEKAPKEFLQEAESLILFHETECALYAAIRNDADKNTVAAFAETLNACKYAPYDQSLLAYANEKYQLETPFTVDKDRTIYRRWEN